MMSAHEKAVGVLDTLSTALTNSNTTIVAPAENLGKQLATLTAQFAMAGHAVHKGNEHDFTVSRWGMSRYCEDFSALQNFATLLGVK